MENDVPFQTLVIFRFQLLIFRAVRGFGGLGLKTLWLNGWRDYLPYEYHELMVAQWVARVEHED